MGRSYQLSKKVTPQQEDQIIREVNGLPDVQRAVLSADRSRLEVVTGSREYADVMALAVNIFRRVGDGCELSFDRFI